MNSITHTSHIEVIAANKGREVFGIEDGQCLKVVKETPAFFFVVSFTGKEIKVSKSTGLAGHWSNKATSPVFNVKQGE